MKLHRPRAARTVSPRLGAGAPWETSHPPRAVPPDLGKLALAVPPDAVHETMPRPTVLHDPGALAAVPPGTGKVAPPDTGRGRWKLWNDFDMNGDVPLLTMNYRSASAGGHAAAVVEAPAPPLAETPTVRPNTSSRHLQLVVNAGLHAFFELTQLATYTHRTLILLLVGRKEDGLNEVKLRVTRRL